MSNRFVLLNIAIPASEELSKEAIKNSEILSKHFSSEFTLQEVGPYPHVTLYYVEFPVKNLGKITDVVNQKFSNRRIDLKFKGVSLVAGYFDIDIERTPELYKLHIEVLTELNQFRDGHIREKWLNEIDEHPVIEKDHLENYGSIRIMETYRPHLTLAKFTDDFSLHQVTSKLDWNWKESIETNIRVFEAGSRGTCIKLL